MAAPFRAKIKTFYSIAQKTEFVYINFSVKRGQRRQPPQKDGKSERKYRPSKNFSLHLKGNMLYSFCIFLRIRCQCSDQSAHRKQ